MVFFPLLTVFDGFCFWVKVILLRYFGSLSFYFDNTRWSVISPAVLQVMQTDRSLESTERTFFRLDSFVPGPRPKCSSKGVFLISESIVKQSIYIALFRLSRKFCVSSKFVFIRFFSDRMVPSTKSCTSV